MNTTTKIKSAPELSKFTTSSALALLWQKAAPEMHLSELDWLARGAGNQIESTTEALSEVLMDIGCLVLADEGPTGSLQSSTGVSSLMFSLSQQMSALSGLTNIAIDAAYMARQARGEKP